MVDKRLIGEGGGRVIHGRGQILRSETCECCDPPGDYYLCVCGADVRSFDLEDLPLSFETQLAGECNCFECSNLILVITIQKNSLTVRAECRDNGTVVLGETSRPFNVPTSPNSCIGLTFSFDNNGGGGQCPVHMTICNFPNFDCRIDGCPRCDQIPNTLTLALQTNKNREYNGFDEPDYYDPVEGHHATVTGDVGQEGWQNIGPRLIKTTISRKSPEVWSGTVPIFREGFWGNFTGPYPPQEFKLYRTNDINFEYECLEAGSTGKISNNTVQGVVRMTNRNGQLVTIASRQHDERYCWPIHYAGQYSRNDMGWLYANGSIQIYDAGQSGPDMCGDQPRGSSPRILNLSMNLNASNPTNKTWNYMNYATHVGGIDFSDYVSGLLYSSGYPITSAPYTFRDFAVRWRHWTSIQLIDWPTTPPIYIGPNFFVGGDLELATNTPLPEFFDTVFMDVGGCATYPNGAPRAGQPSTNVNLIYNRQWRTPLLIERGTAPYQGFNSHTLGWTLSRSVHIPRMLHDNLPITFNTAGNGDDVYLAQEVSTGAAIPGNYDFPDPDHLLHLHHDITITGED